MKLPLKAFAALLLLSLSGIVLYVLEQRLLGYGFIVSSLVIAHASSRELLRDVALVSLGLIIVSLVPISTDISYEHMFLMALAMTATVLGPFLIDRFIYKRHVISFPFGFKEPWGKAKWFYLLLVFNVGYVVLPLYMIGGGMYLNWPAASNPDMVFRLFVGTNALGIWDELFFICIVFTLFYRHLPFWIANVLQAIIFTSFLYELGFEGIGPVLIYIFALTQGYIFKQTHSLFYLLCVHLLFDFILFLVLIHAHNREILQLFMY